MYCINGTVACKPGILLKHTRIYSLLEGEDWKMNFLTYGDKRNKSILFIHGMATTAEICYKPLLPYFKDFYVILAEVDGHSDRLSELKDLSVCCDEIEKYTQDNLCGHIDILSGFSMGATMAVELIGRGNIDVGKTHLDAAFLTKMGVLTKPYEFIFCHAIDWVKRGNKIPKFMIDSVMGKDNNSITDMLYKNITSQTIKNACEFVYQYEIPKMIVNYKGDVSFWHGSNEKYPKLSADLLKRYIPGMSIVVCENMGHGQYLNQHTEEYASRLRAYIGN